MMECAFHRCNFLCTSYTPSLLYIYSCIDVMYYHCMLSSSMNICKYIEVFWMARSHVLMIHRIERLYVRIHLSWWYSNALIKQKTTASDGGWFKKEIMEALNYPKKMNHWTFTDTKHVPLNWFHYRLLLPDTIKNRWNTVLDSVIGYLLQHVVCEQVVLS